ncbi:hypothetical protein AXF42_Ash020699 [Apostasia shenzhenica]|uniref:Uncharacterized protein n=1 Tax=Apostasia shenzhenica TaxID=1088818 RepID=A0A2I0AE08_9ASPA|nr:hypothetical protein AXF42_Ash020699 [Apostasia shenzhenica]
MPMDLKLLTGKSEFKNGKSNKRRLSCKCLAKGMQKELVHMGNIFQRMNHL